MLAKRIFDLSITIPALIILAPFFIIIAILIKIDSHGPVFFIQTRIGYQEKKFKIFKFRTMYTNSKKKSLLTIGVDSRVTKLGKMFRLYKIDELPQLFNVLRGEMSLVGPRPEVPFYVNFYPSKSKKLIFSVLPGITDIMSNQYRNENEILGKYDNPEEIYINKILLHKIKGYEHYVLNQSLFLDLKIILKTFFTILSN